MFFFCIPRPDDKNWWNRKNCLNFSHRVIFVFWIKICNPNLCKSHTFWNTANIGKWHIFTYPVLITKIDETENGRPPTCSVCNTAVTVEHILISCTKYKTKREVVFTDHYTNGSEPSMKSILQESNIFSVNAIMRFLTEVDLLDKI